jgi:hypothetical protein
MKALRKVSNRKFNKAKLRKMAPRGAEYQTAEINTNIYVGKVFEGVRCYMCAFLHTEHGISQQYLRTHTYCKWQKKLV